MPYAPITRFTNTTELFACYKSTIAYRLQRNAMLQPAPCPRPPEEAPPAPVGLPITDYWRQWIAENRLRDCTHETMLKAMNAAGVDGAAAHDAVVAMDRDPVFLAARRHQQL